MDQEKTDTTPANKAALEHPTTPTPQPSAENSQQAPVADVDQNPEQPDENEPVVGTPEQKQEDNQSGDKKEAIKSIISTLAIFILAPIVAIVLTMFVFQSYEVDGPSMETTLDNQDRLIVYKLPKTWADFRGNEFMPSRGEIIVFTQEASTEFSSPESKQLIKRVIGLPGDHVIVKNGKVTIFNDENPSGFNPDAGTDHLDQGEITTGDFDKTIDEGEVFVLGDNRANSLDSRSFGAISTDDIVGTLAMRIYPFHNFQTY